MKMMLGDHKNKTFMANNILFYSSVASSFLHIILFMLVPGFPHQWLYHFALVSSLWNHGSISTYAKWFDRVVIWVSVGHNIYWLKQYFLVSLWSWFGMIFTINAVVFYGVSKLLDDDYEQVSFHFVSHICATASNMCLGVALKD